MATPGLQTQQYYAAGPTAVEPPVYRVTTSTAAQPYQHMSSDACYLAPVPPVITPMHPQYPGSEILMAVPYGIPQAMLPVFERDRESEFALLKMALDNLVGSNGYLSEQYKYQLLLSRLKLPGALHLAKAYMYDDRPYTSALHALQDKYGQARQLVQSERGAILNSPAIKFGDSEAFDSFALSIQSLVGMLGTLEGQNGYELRCGSHVDRLLSKMPPSYRDSFIEYCLSRGILRTGSDLTYTLPHLAAWLQMKSQAKRLSSRAAALYQCDAPKTAKKEQRVTHKERTTTILLNAEEEASTSGSARSKATYKSKPYCPYCDNKEHFLNS